MGINQLFKIYIPIEVVNNISLLINIDLLNLKRNSFTKKDLKESDISSKFEEIQQKLKPYYIPCKYKNYIENLNINKFITIYRQILKLHNFSLVSKDQYEKSKKYILYTVEKKVIDKKQKGTEGIIVFD